MPRRTCNNNVHTHTYRAVDSCCSLVVLCTWRRIWVVFNIKAIWLHKTRAGNLRRPCSNRRWCRRRKRENLRINRENPRKLFRLANADDKSIICCCCCYYYYYYYYKAPIIIYRYYAYKTIVREVAPLPPTDG
jgi:hypothetical protein